MSSRGRRILMVDADGASKFSDLSRLQIALEDLNGKKVGGKKIFWSYFLIPTIAYLFEE